MLDVTVSGLADVTARLNGLDGALAALRSAYAVVGTDLPYARMVHDGTRPHDIAPVGEKALAWPGAAHPVARVHHPGYKGNPFLTGALADKAPEVAARLAQATEGLLGGTAPAGDLARALRDAALIVQAEAQRRANVRTGSLRRSRHAEVYAR